MLYSKKGLRWLAGIGGMVNGWLLLFHPASSVIRPLSGIPSWLMVEGVLVFFLGVCVFLGNRACAWILFFYVLFGKVILVLILRRYYALIPGLFWLWIYYCGIIGTLPKKKRL